MKNLKRINTNGNITEYKFKSETTGGIRYLIIDHDNELVSTNYYLYNGGHRPLEQTQLKEIKRLYNYYTNILKYEDVKEF